MKKWEKRQRERKDEKRKDIEREKKIWAKRQGGKVLENEEETKETHEYEEGTGRGERREQRKDNKSNEQSIIYAVSLPVMFRKPSLHKTDFL